MQIKVFKAATMKDAVAAMRAELGSKAVILHSKKYKESGLLGLRTREVVEITAAVEDPPNQDKKDNTEPKITPAPQPANVAAAKYKKNAAETPKSKTKTEKTDQPLEEEERVSEADIQKLQEALKRAKVTAPIEIESQSDAEILNSQEEAKKTPAPVKNPAPVKTPPVVQKFTPEQITSTPPKKSAEKKVAPPPKVESLQIPPPVEEKTPPPVMFTPEQMAQFQAMMFAQFQQMQAAQNPTPAPPPPKVSEVSLPANSESPEQARIKQLEDELAQMKKMLAEVLNKNSNQGGLSLRDALKKQEVSEEIITEMADTAVDYQSSAARWTLSSYFNEHFNFSEGIRLNRHGVRIVALIGTTGVGKTTTLAKIAAKFVLEQGIRPALITADTYRISAVEQLKTYSDILNLPLDIVYSPQELADALERHKDNELVLIDTAGRSQYSEAQMAELKEFLNTNPRIEKHLAISASFKLNDAREIVNKFSAVNPDRIIITKIDETGNFGTAVNLLRNINLPLSFLTMGQSVPDDIAVGSADTVTKLLLDKISRGAN
ncbi:MAG: flagellar biosynthesis protein FlhF [Selenomonadaceae bacterium]|nr:flagellar biosynthesis protein FlhF [Selenomonadaceae bacterium]